jgi:arylsulfatase
LMTFVCGVGCFGELKEEAVLPRPNILLILVDDMGFSDLSCTGGEIPTPHIDRIAREGRLVTNFYNAARCCPSRAALLTGRYPHAAGMGHQNQDRGHPSYRGRIRREVPTMGELFRSAGYRTYQVGKWHVGDARDAWPDRRGFDDHFALIEGAMNYYNRRPWLKKMDSLTLSYQGRPYEPPADFYATRTFTDTTVAFLSRHDYDRQPFLFYLAYNAPHWPLHAPGAAVERFRGSYAAGWDSMRQTRFERVKTLGLLAEEAPLPPRWPTVPAWASVPLPERDGWSGKMNLYAAVMHELDVAVGRVLTELERLDQLDRTIVLLLSDNGASYEDPVPPDAPWADHPTSGRPGGPLSFPSYGTPWANLSNTPYNYFKSFLHEGGIATPLLVRYPGAVPAGGPLRTGPGHILDILPTLQEAAGLPGSPTGGQSQWSAWTDDQYDPGEGRWLFWEHQFNRAVRHGDWKLVSVYRPLDGDIRNRWELYDLAKDPTEQMDLADRYPARVDSMADRYQRWATEVGVLDAREMRELSIGEP